MSITAKFCAIAAAPLGGLKIAAKPHAKNPKRANVKTSTHKFVALASQPRRRLFKRNVQDRLFNVEFRTIGTIGFVPRLLDQALDTALVCRSL